MTGLLIIDLNASPRVVTSAKRARTYTHEPLVARFESYVDRNGPIPPHCPELGPCWLWTGSNDGHGYGCIRENGKTGRLLKAHRVAWAIANGALPDDMHVCHHCDNPPCVRDSHLFLGTDADNQRDAREKGRAGFQVKPDCHPRGEDVAGAKLTESDVIEIFALYADGWKQVRLAERFGVTQANISALLKGKTWKHLQRLGTRKLVESVGAGEVRASATLFED